MMYYIGVNMFYEHVLLYYLYLNGPRFHFSSCLALENWVVCSVPV
jgi:hypothetical protein